MAQRKYTVETDIREEIIKRRSERGNEGSYSIHFNIIASTTNQRIAYGSIVNNFHNVYFYYEPQVRGSNKAQKKIILERFVKPPTIKKKKK